MRKYIVPCEGNVLKWKRLFHEVFRDEKHQAPLMKELVDIASAVPLDSEKNKQHTMLGLLLSCMEVAQDLAETGMLENDDVVYAAKVAADIVSSLAYGLSERSVLTQTNLLTFEGFTSMDMIVAVFEEGEIYEMEERVWLTE